MSNIIKSGAFETFHVVKYWATQGILVKNMEVIEFDDGKVYARGVCWARVGREAFKTLEEALAFVRKAAAKKAAKLRKDADRFEEMAKGQGIKVVR